MSNPTVYQDFQPRSQPGFLQGPIAQSWGAGCGYAKDIYVEMVIGGLECRFPSICPEDALAYHGTERGLPRYASDTLDSYRARVVDAWGLWSAAGTEVGILQALAYAGVITAQIYEPAEWPITGFTDWWNFWVLIDARGGSWGAIWHVGDGTLIGSGVVVGFTSPPIAVADILAVINTWKPAHTVLQGLVVLLSGWLVGQRGVTVGAPGLTVGAESVEMI